LTCCVETGSEPWLGYGGITGTGNLNHGGTKDTGENRGLGSLFLSVLSVPVVDFPRSRLPPWTFGFSPAPSNPVKVGQGQSRSSLPNRRHPRPAPHAPSLAPSRVKPSQGRPSARHPGPKTPDRPRPENRVSQTFRGRAVSHPAATRPADVNHPGPLTRATRPDLGCQTSSKPV